MSNVLGRLLTGHPSTHQWGRIAEQHSQHGVILPALNHGVADDHSRYLLVDRIPVIRDNASNVDLQ
jgi:hypothetical protein